jgi:iron complex transport system substrate-binding protein
VRMAGLESFPGSVLGDLGLSRPRAQQGSREYESLSAEQLPAVDGDLMLLSVAPGAGGALRRLEATPAWRRLGVVRSGRVVRVDAGTWWSGGGILAARAAMRDVARVFDRR